VRFPTALCAPLVAAVLLAHGALAQGFLAGESEGEDQPFDVTADSVEHDAQRGVYVARGNVRITQPERVLSADWVGFSSETRQGLASGNVVIIEGDDVLRADVLQFQIDSAKGLVYRGNLEGGGTRFLMSGDTIQKTGEDTYVFDEGKFTSCKCPEGGREPWAITADKANLDIGGYGTARNTAFEVLGVPVVWLPWMIYPLKKDRASGFLFPVWNASSRRGFDIGLPFFWAVGERLNLTLTASYLTENGFMPSVEGEYVFGEKSSGQFYGAWIDDKNIDPDDPSTPFSSQRWALGLLHEQYLPYDFRFVVDARFFSDNLYAFDFEKYSDYRRDRFVESQAFLERRFGSLDRYGFFGAVQYAEDQQNPDDQDRDEFLLQRMPQLHLSGVPQRLDRVVPGLVGSFDVDYVNYWARDSADDVFGNTPFFTDPESPNFNPLVTDRFVDTGIDAIPDGDERNENGDIVRADGTVELEDGAVIPFDEYAASLPGGSAGDTITSAQFLAALDGSRDNFPTGPERDGSFQEGEPLSDSGHRILVNPRLSYPLRLWDAVEVNPELGYHGTLYQTDNLGYEDRHLFTAQLDVRTRLRRAIGLPFGGGNALHVLAPYANWTSVTDESQDDNPLFTPQPAVMQDRVRHLALMNLSRDTADRIEQVNALTLGANNRVYVPRDDAEGTRLFADVDLAFVWDVEDDGFQGLLVDGAMWPLPRVRTRVNLSYDIDESELAEGLFAVSWSHEEGHDLGVGYRYVENAPRFFEAFLFDDERFDEFEEGVTSINQIFLFARWAVTRSWALTYRMTYSFEESFFLGNEAGVEYVSGCNCWAIRLEVEDERTRGFQVNVRYRLIGLGDDTIRPFQSGRRTRQQQFEDEEL
jgi:lipopolysaccharide assembly outer membrane protein LptD (OstA)